MRKNHRITKSLIAFCWLFGLPAITVGTAIADPIICEDVSNNHMIIDDSQVSACLDAGTGNINGNPSKDPFLLSGGTAAGYSLVSKDDASNPFNIETSQAGSAGAWSIDASFWSTNIMGAIGFKFGTGNQPDEWFVFKLNPDVSVGNWEFINVYGKGGGLSHTNLYGSDAGSIEASVPETSALALLGFGLFGIGLFRRRKKV